MKKEGDNDGTVLHLGEHEARHGDEYDDDLLKEQSSRTYDFHDHEALTA